MHRILRELRRRKGVSQLELACELDVSQQAVSKWERGVAEPEIRFLRMLADYYGVSVDYLVGHTVTTDAAYRDLMARFEELLKRLTPEQAALLYAIAVESLEDVK